MERKSFILHETGIFLIGPRTPISNLFYLGKKTVSATTKKQCFVLRQTSLLRTALLPSHLSNLRAATNRFRNLLELRKAEA